MVSHEPAFVRIAAHGTPHHSDPPNAHEFYGLLGMLIVAWGRLEGHVIGNLLTIMNLPEVAPSGPLPLAWDRRFELWKRAFSNVPALKPHKDRAITFMESITKEATDRNFIAHAIWDEFVDGATEPTIDARAIRPKRKTPHMIDVIDQPVSLSMLRQALAVANQLNFGMNEFTRLLGSLRPPPADARKF
jgi:hypothetical protein